MDTLKNLNDSLKYIEKNLFNDIDLEKVFLISGMSQYQYKRVFSYLNGMSLNEYIRKRKLALAAKMLLDDPNLKVSDIAFDLGYESVEAFSKAFYNMHLVNPSILKKKTVNINDFPPLSFQLSVKGGYEMKYRIENKEAYKLVGVKKEVALQHHGVNEEIVELAKQLTEEKIEKLKAISNIDPKGIVNATIRLDEDLSDGTKIMQMIGVATTMPTTDLENEFTIYNVDASEYAIFSVEGVFPDALQLTWSRIYSEWLISSGYEIIKGPEILWNESHDTSKKNFKSEIWIPVQRKK